jgi:hypothetical protein
MAAKHLIHNTVYLPIDTNRDGIEQKYVACDISGNIYMDQIYSKSELLTMYKDNPKFYSCNNLVDITKTWSTRD